MGLRYKKSIKLAPGVKLNLSKRGAGVSFGGKGYRYTIGSNGRRTTTLGIPGTGLSYSTSSGGRKRHSSPSHKRSSSSKSQNNNYYREQERKKNYDEVNSFNQRLNCLKSLHTRAYTIEIEWKKEASRPEPFVEGNAGPNELKAIDELNNFKPTLFEKWFLHNGEKRKNQLEAQIPLAREKDVTLYNSWKNNVAFANRVISGDIDAYYEVIQDFNPFDSLVDWGSGFEFGTSDPNCMEVEFMVKSKDVIPTTSKSLTKTGKLSEKNMTKTAYYDYTQDYVCSCSICIARELFALLPISKVLVHATDTILDTATGLDKEATILSVIFERSSFENINFERIDASDFTETFQHNMKFRKTSGFLPVDRLFL